MKQRLMRTSWYRELFEVPADLLDLSRHPGSPEAFYVDSVLFLQPLTTSAHLLIQLLRETAKPMVLNMIDLAKTATQTLLISFKGGAIWPNARDLSTTANQDAIS
jgi:hypothetical protein